MDSCLNLLKGLQMDSENKVNATETNEYVAPQIESVTTPEELEREVQYAGISHSHP
jgi:hypothetical protein